MLRGASVWDGCGSPQCTKQWMAACSDSRRKAFTFLFLHASFQSPVHKFNIGKVLGKYKNPTCQEYFLLAKIIHMDFTVDS